MGNFKLRFNSQIILTKSILPALIILATIFSCTEKPDTIGLDLVDDAKFSVKDTILYVKAYSTLEGRFNYTEFCLFQLLWKPEHPTNSQSLQG